MAFLAVLNTTCSSGPTNSRFHLPNGFLAAPTPFVIALQEARRADLHRRNYSQAYRNLTFEVRSGDKVQHRSLRKDVKATERTFDKLENLTPSLTGALFVSTFYINMQLQRDRVSL